MKNVKQQIWINCPSRVFTELRNNVLEESVHLNAATFFNSVRHMSFLVVKDALSDKLYKK